MAPEQKSDPKPQSGSESAAPDLPTIHPSFIQVAKPYIFEQTIQKCMTAMDVDPRREESLRLQGVTWIDNVRRALNLPIRTFNTAVVYYHKFRLVHHLGEYNNMDAAAASLFVACKIEDTLKKSREILCASYNLKLSQSEHISSDNGVLDDAARGIIGLERLMLESSGFDFRTRHPQKTLIKLARKYGLAPQSEVSNVAYRISQDLYRTFVPLKQTTSTMAFSCLELAGRLLEKRIEAVERGTDYPQWQTSREEVMETLLDLLELYTHNRSATTVGPHFPADRFLTVRIPLNKEVEEHRLPRYTHSQSETTSHSHHDDKHSKDSRQNGPTTNGSSAKAEKEKTDPATGRIPHPLIPATANGERLVKGEKGQNAAVRFIVDSEYAEAEKARVAQYFRVEMEEYEVEE
ncbi:cyclin-like protein [Aspergillus karnatakaensis]|uniref:putative cyclin n=1 Tax=Aspergillus karnatakaensis TaxID=1810916 RepID=UPI003CCDB696